MGETWDTFDTRILYQANKIKAQYDDGLGVGGALEYDHGSGTTIKMGDKYSEKTCVSMWRELGNKVTLQSFDDLITLWYRNLEEYVVTGGKVESGEIPFAMQFLSSEWLPELKPEDLKTLREHFCAKDDESGSKVVDVAASEEDGEAIEVNTSSKCE